MRRAAVDNHRLGVHVRIARGRVLPYRYTNINALAAQRRNAGVVRKILTSIKRKNQSHLHTPMGRGDQLALEVRVAEDLPGRVDRMVRLLDQPGQLGIRIIGPR